MMLNAGQGRDEAIRSWLTAVEIGAVVGKDCPTFEIPLIIRVLELEGDGHHNQSFCYIDGPGRPSLVFFVAVFNYTASIGYSTNLGVIPKISWSQLYARVQQVRYRFK